MDPFTLLLALDIMDDKEKEKEDNKETYYDLSEDEIMAILGI